MKENNIDYIIHLMKKFTTSDKPKKGKSDVEMKEQDAAAAGGGSKPAPYPTVTKWASGRKFGPTYNPEKKTWETGLTRGKANTLL